MQRFRARNGFTLIEVLLAVALGAGIVTVAISVVMSMGALWGAGINDRLFEKHTRGVSRFLEQAFRSAESRYDVEAETPPVFWFDWEGDGRELARYLSFELEKAPGAFVWPSDPLPHVVCSLDFEAGEGLFLLWRSRLEEDFEREAPRRTLVSPFVTAIRYYYIDYEEENPEWEVEEEPRVEAGQEYVDPQRIELVFSYKSREVLRQLNMPNGMEGVPIF